MVSCNSQREGRRRDFCETLGRNGQGTLQHCFGAMLAIAPGIAVHCFKSSKTGAGSWKSQIGYLGRDLPWALATWGTFFPLGEDFVQRQVGVITFDKTSGCFFKRKAIHALSLVISEGDQAVRGVRLDGISGLRSQLESLLGGLP